MANIKKHYGKWQARVRRKKIVAIKSFLRKGDAVKWAYKTEAQIETGQYLTVKKQERLNEINYSWLFQHEPYGHSIKEKPTPFQKLRAKLRADILTFLMIS